MGLFIMVWNALEADDLDGAGEEILAWYPAVTTADLGDNAQRTAARNFLSACIRFLDRRNRSVIAGVSRP